MRIMSDDERLISGVPLFNGLEDKHLKAVVDIAISRNYSKNELIFSEGDDGNGFYIVAEGKVKIFKLSPEGKEQILHIFDRGEPFGEVPVFSGDHFPASAQALTNLRLLFFPRDAFVDSITKSPALTMNMLSVLSRRLRQFTVQIENLTLKEVPARLAAYLIMHAEKAEDGGVVTLKIPKNLLANMLGTAPETLSRILSRMTESGLIQVDNKTIIINDYEGLEAISENR